MAYSSYSRFEFERLKRSTLAAEKAGKALVVFKPQALDGNDCTFQQDDKNIAQHDRYTVTKTVQHGSDCEYRRSQGNMVKAEGRDPQK